jgi:hypothetical protein
MLNNFYLLHFILTHLLFFNWQPRLWYELIMKVCKINCYFEIKDIIPINDLLYFIMIFKHIMYIY